MNIITGDLLDITEGYLGHQVNTCGVFNAGIAKQIRIKYPSVYEAYMKEHQEEGWLLGDLQVINLTKELSICNIAGQSTYGRTGVHTKYPALELGLKKLNRYSEAGFQVYLPYKIGCGNAGGDWKKVCEIIERVIPQGDRGKAGSRVSLERGGKPTRAVRQAH